MRTLTIGFAVFLLYAVPARWHYVCKVRNLCENDATKNVAANNLKEIPPRTKDLMLQSNDSTILANFEQFGFQPNSAELQLSENNKKYLAGIADFLKKEPDSNLEIKGYYYENEKNSNGIYDNLGLARAAAIRDYLMNEYGFRSNRFKLDHESITKGSSAYLDQPLSYNITTNRDTEVKARGGETLVEASYTFDRMTFSDINFAYNEAAFKPSPNFINYADSVKIYLEKNPKKKITIIGHADNKGADKYNYGLGLRRANNVILFLKDKTGIPLNKMDAISEGEKKPIAPNNTDDNRRKNRRVEVLIK